VVHGNGASRTCKWDVILDEVVGEYLISWAVELSEELLWRLSSHCVQLLGRENISKACRVEYNVQELGCETRNVMYWADSVPFAASNWEVCTEQGRRFMGLLALSAPQSYAY
jgi:hypothetical protein